VEVLDNPSQWARVIPAPSDVNQRKFQRRLDRITGRTPSGRSRVRLVWGWSPEARVWHRGEWRARYRFHTVHLPSGDQVDLAVPRWFLEELVEPAQYKDQWNALRYEWDGIEPVDVTGPPPEGGWYVPLALVAAHDGDKGCCVAEWAAQRRKCWGSYKPPTDSDLEMIQRAVKLRDQAKQFNRTDEPMSKEALEDCRKVQFEKKKQYDEDMAEHYENIIRGFMNTMGPLITSDDPTVHRWGTRHFLSGHSKSGLIIP
jgi:hypothetical protein